MHIDFHFTIICTINIEYSKTNQPRGHRDPAHHTTTPLPGKRGYVKSSGTLGDAAALGDDGFAEAVLESDGALEEKAHGGNGAWIRGEVAEASAALAARNLAHANAVAGPVRPRKTLYLRFGKRVLDVVLSGAALLLTLPVNAVLAVLPTATSARPSSTSRSARART
ncbi:hypothetical protein [Eggerthella lenta]|uniref:hypothetical protein n=1 Tax=Eggerthella lenta TaxID=84112 RepID=UPI001EE19263|nr:hypothetical protein [Eggerthella lenta]